MQRVLIGSIRFYQRYVSRWTPAVCRFRPTCSEYAAQAIARHGALRGLAMALRRLCRCHPFHPGGYDPVK
jgi:putative membrane protein insertion efficiency factor